MAKGFLPDPRGGRASSAPQGPVSNTRAGFPPCLRAETSGATIPPGGPAFSSHSVAVPSTASDSPCAPSLASAGPGATYAAAPAHVRAFIAQGLRNVAGRV